MIKPGEEFQNVAAPSREVLRKLVYLAEIDSDSVISGHAAQRGALATERANRSADDFHNINQMLAEQNIRAARLADPAYQALATSIGEDFDRLDEASVVALLQIEEELAELHRQRERLHAEAFTDTEGRTIFATEDQNAAYYEDGARLSDETFQQIRHRLTGRPTHEEWLSSLRREEELFAERDRIHHNETERARLLEDLANGSISKEDARDRRQTIREELPERVRKVASGLELTDEELAALEARAPQDDAGQELSASLPSPGGP
ncbi:hypothetical protein ACFMBG_14840 [Leisingera sp. D0M16]|uniref:hypothetical protein n=1 Tax=Leisingera coralii TaxID=3351347 RepID=UPI003B7A5B85